MFFHRLHKHTLLRPMTDTHLQLQPALTVLQLRDNKRTDSDVKQIFSSGLSRHSFDGWKRITATLILITTELTFLGLWSDLTVTDGTDKKDSD